MADEQLKPLVRKRASLKSRVTIFGNFIREFQQNLVDKTKLEELDLIQIKQRLNNIEAVIAEFCEVQTNIETIAENLEEQFAERELFEKSFYSQTSLATRLIEISEPRVDESKADASVGSASQGYAPQRGVKLPTIPVPKFNGDIQNWLEFRETYESLIHTNNSISTIEKYHYLKASLEGVAAQVIKSIEFTVSCYDLAWHTLCDRFNNTRLLIFNHVKAIFEVEPIHKESSDKIRKLVDTVNKHLKSLEQLNQPVSHWDTLIIFIITQRLDKVSLTEWEKFKFNNDVPTMEEFRSFLKGRADLLETIELGRGGQVKQTSGTRAFFTKQGNCIVCQGEHAIYSCTEFKGLSIEN